MAAVKMTIEQRETHLLKVSMLYLAGKWQHEIAAACSVSRQQITYDIKQLNTRWKESQLANIDEKKAKELAKVDELERKYHGAWERSCCDDQVGDPRFLSGVQWCIEQRCKILNLIEDASKHHITGQVNVVNWDALLLGLAQGVKEQPAPARIETSGLPCALREIEEPDAINGNGEHHPESNGD